MMTSKKSSTGIHTTGKVKTRMTTSEQRKAALRLARKNAVENSVKRQRDLWAEQVPKRFRGYSFDTDIIGASSPLTAAEKIALRNCAKSPDPFILMHGSTGVGKTTAACALVSKIVEDAEREARPLSGGRPVFYSANSLLRELSVMDRKNNRVVAERVFDLTCRASILLLDDVGAGNDGRTERQERMLWDILNERYNDPDKITIFTTNMARKSKMESRGLEEFFGVSMWDRIESTMCDIRFGNTESLRTAANSSTATATTTDISEPRAVRKRSRAVRKRKTDEQ